MVGGLKYILCDTNYDDSTGEHPHPYLSTRVNSKNKTYHPPIFFCFMSLVHNHIYLVNSPTINIRESHVL